MRSSLLLSLLGLTAACRAADPVDEHLDATPAADTATLSDRRPGRMGTRIRASAASCTASRLDTSLDAGVPPGSNFSPRSQLASITWR